MDAIILKNQTASGDLLEATFLPALGMNMRSFKRGEIEAIDQSTQSLFEERFAGLGALIGPHFHHRHVLPEVKDESLFPHIARVKAKGIAEPFSHGIARYAPWKAEAGPTWIKAVLSGKDTWQGVPLSDLEGQNFTMTFAADLQPDGLRIDMSVVSDTDSLVGLHYYFRLPQGKGRIESKVQSTYMDKGQAKPLPKEWLVSDQQDMAFSMEQPADYTLYPYPNPCQGDIRLITNEYRLRVLYKGISQESAWQLFHPAGASFVCIEPVSAKDPRHPNLTVSSLHVHLNIEKD